MQQRKRQYPKLEQELVRQGRSKAWLGRQLRNGTGKPMSRADINARMTGYHGMAFPDSDKAKIARLLGKTTSDLF